MVPEIAYTAPQSVTEAVASIGRTEDIRFSPNNQRLAVAAFTRNRVAVFDIDLTSFRDRAQVALTGGVEISSSVLSQPHGVDFIDDDTVIVACRTGDVALFKLPLGEKDVRSHEVLPIAKWPAGRATLLNMPGSVTVADTGENTYEVLICNNAGNTVTRHVLERHAAGVIRSREVLLQRHLDIPDSVSVSSDRRWIAVSNHGTHNVLLYENSPSLNADSGPDGILRRVYYPHGLRFSSDGRYLFVADAGAPYVHVYAQHHGEWRGVSHPVAAVRVMDEAVFQKGRHNPREGGPKGLDIDADSNVLVVTSECQPLAFFDLRALLRPVLAGGSMLEQRGLDIDYELTVMRENHDIAKIAMEAKTYRQSKSWRMTAPLRYLNSILHRRKSSL